MHVQDAASAKEKKKRKKKGLMWEVFAGLLTRVVPAPSEKEILKHSLTLSFQTCSFGPGYMFQPRASPAASLLVRELGFQTPPPYPPCVSAGSPTPVHGIDPGFIRFCWSVTEVPCETSAEQLLNIGFVARGRQMSFVLARKSSLCRS